MKREDIYYKENASYYSINDDIGLPFYLFLCDTNAEATTPIKKSPLYREIQSGAVAKLYMRKGFLIYEEMRKYFPIYEEAVSHM